MMLAKKRKTPAKKAAKRRASGRTHIETGQLADPKHPPAKTKRKK